MTRFERLRVRAEEAIIRHSLQLFFWLLGPSKAMSTAQDPPTRSRASFTRALGVDAWGAGDLDSER